MRRAGVCLTLVILLGASARAADENATIQRATELLEEIAASPDSGLPAQALREAKGIMVVPHIVNTQLGVGHKRGDGIYLPRSDDGRWGPPQLVRMANLTVGIEAGRQVSDLVVLYRTRKAAEDNANRLAFGANFTYLNRDSFRRSADPRRFRTWKAYGYNVTNEDVATYFRSRGHVLGVRLEGDLDTRAEPKSTEPGGVALGHPIAGAPAQANPPHQTEPLTSPLPTSPEAERLRAVLAALTTSPAPVVVARPSVDPQVQATAATGEPTPIAPAAIPPR